jgi:hypothetical protein
MVSAKNAIHQAPRPALEQHHVAREPRRRPGEQRRCLERRLPLHDDDPAPYEHRRGKNHE